MTLCRNRQSAEDLYQETWLKAWKYRSKFDASRDFEPWITKICVRQYASVLSRLKNLAATESAESVDWNTDFGTGDMVSEHAGVMDLKRAVKDLPDRYRTMVILYYFEDMSIKDTAEVLGIPEGTVKSGLNAARKMLKEELL